MQSDQLDWAGGRGCLRGFDTVSLENYGWSVMGIVVSIQSDLVVKVYHSGQGQGGHPCL